MITLRALFSKWEPLRAQGFQQKLFSIVLKLIDKWEPPLEHTKN